RGLPPRRFRGSITRPWHSLSTLRPVHCCTRTQDSLPAVGHSTGRAWLPAGFRRKVSSCFLHLFPLSQAFLAQCQLLNGLSIRLLQAASDRSRPAVGDWLSIHADDGQHLRGRAGDEQLRDPAKIVALEKLLPLRDAGAL